MSDARAQVLGRVRRALADVPGGERSADVTVARDYRHTGDLDLPGRVQRLGERLRDYDAEVIGVAGEHEVAAAVADACQRMGLRQVVVPQALAAGWRPGGVVVIEDDGRSARELDGIDGAVTGCAVAIAETGTLILDGQASSGRRAITLVPDHHICIVTGDQIVALVPEAIAALAPAVRDHRAPITLISGPSASSDIELSRVEGVHGPRHLVVVIVAGPES